MTLTGREGYLSAANAALVPDASIKAPMPPA
jgi:hypothetical protein